jgi:hypothetical protein
MPMDVLEQMLGYVVFSQWNMTRTSRECIQLGLSVDPGKYVEIVETKSQDVAVSIPLEMESFTITFPNTKQAYEYVETFLLDYHEDTAQGSVSRKRNSCIDWNASGKKRVKFAG